jgi:hypothetical protein
VKADRSSAANAFLTSTAISSMPISIDPMVPLDPPEGHPSRGKATMRSD